MLGADLVELDVASGSVNRTVSEWFGGDGIFRGDLNVSPDRSTLYFAEGYEDSWYMCESSVGNIGRIDLAGGQPELLYVGTAPALSADGSRLAYLGSNVCVPDPEQPDIWVLTPYDHVVVVDLATDQQVVITTAVTPADYTDPSALEWVGFGPSGDLLVKTAGGDLHRVPSDAPSTVQDHPIVVGGMTASPVDLAGDALVVVEFGDEGSSTLQLLDLGTGAATDLLAVERYVAVGVSTDGHVIAADELSDTSGTDGPLTVVVTDDFVGSIDW